MYLLYSYQLLGMRISFSERKVGIITHGFMVVQGHIPQCSSNILNKCRLTYRRNIVLRVFHLDVRASASVIPKNRSMRVLQELRIRISFSLKRKLYHCNKRRTLSCPMSTMTAQTSINQQLSNTRTSLMPSFSTIKTHSFTTSHVTQRTAVSAAICGTKTKGLAQNKFCPWLMPSRQRRRASSTQETEITSEFLRRRVLTTPGRCCSVTSKLGGVP